MDLKVHTRSHGETTIIEIGGEVDLHGAPELRAELHRVTEKSVEGATPQVVADLSGVSFIDSTGIGVLVGALKRARESGGAFHFCGAQPRVRRVFEITGLIRVLPFFESRDEAVAAFAGEKSEKEAPNVAKLPSEEAMAPQTLAQEALVEAAFLNGAVAGGCIELRIPASSEWVRVARLTAAGVASRLDFSLDDIEDIKLAVAEAINNAIQHVPVSRQQDETPIVTLTLQVLADGLQIQVIDQGRVAEGLQVAERSPIADFHDPDDLPEGGLGLMLIQTLMDEVSHDSGPHADTTLKMFKRVTAR